VRVERNTTHDALHQAGAVTVRQIDSGVYEVEPDIDLALLDAAEDKTRKARLIAHTKATAYRHITARLPEWQQRNLTARSAELLRIRHDRAWTAEEAAEADAIEAQWEWVKSVRAYSDQVEADIVAGLITTTAEVEGANWPA
jgi:hypothetical protein